MFSMVQYDGSSMPNTRFAIFIQTMNFRLILQKIVFLLPWIALFAALSPFPVLASGPAPETNSECVILLHGLGRTADSMEDLAGALETAGFDTIKLIYPSRDFPIETLAMDTIPRGIRHCQTQGAKTPFRNPLHGRSCCAAT